MTGVVCALKKSKVRVERQRVMASGGDYVRHWKKSLGLDCI